jgi:hypothetical protein
MTTTFNFQQNITIEAQLEINEGFVSAPGLAFQGELNTGIASTGPGEISLISQGNFIVTAAQSFVSSNVPFAAPEDVAGTGFVFKDGLSRDTGMFSDTPGEIGFATFGIEKMRITDSGVLSFSGTSAQVVLPSHPVASLPGGTLGGTIFVPDETGGPVPAYFDGTDWRRVTDGAVVS